MRGFWDVGPYSLVEVDQHFRCSYCRHHRTMITLMMSAVTISETSANFNETKQRIIPDGCHLHTFCCENLKYRVFPSVFSYCIRLRVQTPLTNVRKHFCMLSLSRCEQLFSLTFNLTRDPYAGILNCIKRKAVREKK